MRNSPILGEGRFMNAGIVAPRLGRVNQSIVPRTRNWTTKTPRTPSRKRRFPSPLSSCLCAFVVNPHVDSVVAPLRDHIEGAACVPLTSDWCGAMLTQRRRVWRSKWNPSAGPVGARLRGSFTFGGSECHLTVSDVLLSEPSSHMSGPYDPRPCCWFCVAGCQPPADSGWRRP